MTKQQTPPDEPSRGSSGSAGPGGSGEGSVIGASGGMTPVAPLLPIDHLFSPGTLWDVAVVLRMLFFTSQLRDERLVSVVAISLT